MARRVTSVPATLRRLLFSCACTTITLSASSHLAAESVRLVAVSPRTQKAVQGELVPTPFAARVERASGEAIAGAVVLFQVDLCYSTVGVVCPAGSEYGGFEAGVDSLRAEVVSNADGIATAPAFRAGFPTLIHWPFEFDVIPYVPAQTVGDLIIDTLDASLPIGGLGSARTTVSIAAEPHTCSPQVRPAASLLFPYFTVDLDNASGATTLFAIGNANDQATLARVTLWTDWGVPTLAFDIFLARNAVQAINLRDLFSGALPSVPGGASFSGCTDPLSRPFLGAAELAQLRARHTGIPDPRDGRCYGRDRGESGRAVGFVTVDAMRRCPAAGATPLDEEYFSADGTGAATDANVLYGDFYLVNSSENSAQGNAAVHLVADRELHSERTFYFNLREDANDHRAPIGTRHRARFASGGPFAGATTLAVFALPNVAPSTSGWTCGQSPRNAPELCENFLQFTLRDEAGLQQTLLWRFPEAVVRTYQLGGPELPTPVTFGSVDVENITYFACGMVPGGPRYLGSWVLPIQSASGRYSVGLDPIRLEPGCSP